MMSLPAMPFGDRFCFSGKGRIGGRGWMNPKGANIMAASGLSSRNDLVGTGRVISVLFGINRVGHKRSHLVGPPFPEIKTNFQLWQVGISRET